MLLGRSLKSICRDVADGYVSITPLTLKKVDEEGLKALLDQLLRVQTETRSQCCPAHDLDAIRQRNMRLQRIHNAIFVAKNLARERRIKI